ncbi:MAG: hypothetical protein PVI26_07095 [Chitinispirillia bacterium]|jgi:hypothetical protein
MKIKIKLFRSAICLFLFCLFCFGEKAENEDIIVKGKGYGSNETEAMMAAKRDAVEKSIGMILLSQTEIDNFQNKRDIVITKSLGAVKMYTVISSTKSFDGAYTIEIKAKISWSVINENLSAFNILLKSMEKPKIMVIIQENNIGYKEPTNCTAENSIVKFLKDSCDFEIVDTNIVASIKTSSKKMASLFADDVSTAASIGAMHGAEVIIIGKAESRVSEKESNDLGGMKSVSADVKLRVINCTTGKLITSVGRHAEKVHISPYTAGLLAINIASEKAIKELINSVIEKWNRQINNGLPLIVTVSEVSSFRLKNAVIHTLKSIPGIVNVRDRAWDEVKEVLLADIQFKGNTNEFCDRVDGYKMYFGGGSLAITGQNGTNISIVIQVK